MRAFTRDTPDSVKKALRLGSTKDHFLLYDSPAELAADYGKRRPEGFDGRLREWDGNVTTTQAIDMATRGDMAGVAASDALISKFERFAFDTVRKLWTDDVTGAVPNVPAYIAGHPLNMRRRVRNDDTSAPIAVVVDLTTSAVLTADHIRKRGAAILALVRVLSSRRAVELWAGAMIDADRMQNSVSIFCRIDTAPLDLATAAHVMTHASFPRRLCYGIAKHSHRFAGYWPYGYECRHRKHMSEIIAPAFEHATQTLCLPSLDKDDESVNSPERWLEARLAELAPVDLAA